MRFHQIDVIGDGLPYQADLFFRLGLCLLQCQRLTFLASDRLERDCIALPEARNRSFDGGGQSGVEVEVRERVG